MTTTTTVIKELSDKGSDGVRLGQSAADLISFHGSTPVAQAAVASVATGGTMVSIVVTVQSLLTILATKGLISLT